MDFLKKDFTDKSSIWNKQYETGQWEILKSKIEEPRFDALVQLTYEYFQDANILEIGCGEGLFLRKIASIYSFFLGIDISAVAINKALELKSEKADFLVADMERFKPLQKFDLIIFNESLYYAEQPIEIIKYYMQFLTSNGVVATSIFDNNIKVIEQIRSHFQVIKHTKTTNQRGTWHADVFQRD